MGFRYVASYISSVGIIKSKGLINLLEGIFKWFYNRFDHILLGSESFKEFAKKRVISIKHFISLIGQIWFFESQKPIKRKFDPQKSDNFLCREYWSRHKILKV